MPKRLRLFLDTSALLAGLNSPTGAAGVIIAEATAQKLTIVISSQVIEEAERVIADKFPKLYIAWTNFLLLPLEITQSPSLRAVKTAYSFLPTSDAPILASAIQCKPDALITWNTRDFMRPVVIAAVNFPILRPGEFLQQIWYVD